MRLINVNICDFFPCKCFCSAFISNDIFYDYIKRDATTTAQIREHNTSREKIDDCTTQRCALLHDPLVCTIITM